jgi:hypothetical protein
VTAPQALRQKIELCLPPYLKAVRSGNGLQKKKINNSSELRPFCSPKYSVRQQQMVIGTNHLFLHQTNHDITDRQPETKPQRKHAKVHPYSPSPRAAGNKNQKNRHAHLYFLFSSLLPLLLLLLFNPPPPSPETSDHTPPSSQT